MPGQDRGRKPKGLEDYDRLKLLGKGSFGKAWKVKHTITSDIRVAKEIKCANKQDLDDALGEASVLSKLNHAFIVGYFDVIKSSAKLVTIVMEFCPGGDLGEKIARRKYRHQHFDESVIKLWFVQVLDAVSYLHGKGILHRDIKCGNVFLGENDVAKLGDFGIARVLDRNAVSPAERTTRTPVGTPMNMSPEICKGERYGQKADIWALGCVLYEMVSLRPAFMAYDMDSLVRKIKRGHHDKFIPKHYTIDVAKLIDGMLQVDARRRPTAGDMMKMPYLSKTILDAEEIKKGLLKQQAVQDPAESKQTEPQIMVLDHTTKGDQGVKLQQQNGHVSHDNDASSHGALSRAHQDSPSLGYKQKHLLHSAAGYSKPRRASYQDQHLQHHRHKRPSYQAEAAAGRRNPQLSDQRGRKDDNPASLLNDHFLPNLSPQQRGRSPEKGTHSAPSSPEMRRREGLRPRSHSPRYGNRWKLPSSSNSPKAVRSPLGAQGFIANQHSRWK